MLLSTSFPDTDGGGGDEGDAMSALADDGSGSDSGGGSFKSKMLPSATKLFYHKQRCRIEMGQ